MMHIPLFSSGAFICPYPFCQAKWRFCWEWYRNKKAGKINTKWFNKSHKCSQKCWTRSIKDRSSPFVGASARNKRKCTVLIFANTQHADTQSLIQRLQAHEWMVFRRVQRTIHEITDLCFVANTCQLTNNRGVNNHFEIFMKSRKCAFLSNRWHSNIYLKHNYLYV